MPLLRAPCTGHALPRRQSASGPDRAGRSRGGAPVGTALTLLFLATACATAIPVEETTFAPSVGVSLAAMERTPSGLYLEDLSEGEGPEVAPGDRVAVHYVGWLADGTQFDGLVPPEEPAEFTVGQGEVVPGLDEGVVGMKAGGQRRIVVPSELGYGSLGAGNVPPNAVLVFVVDLVEIR